MKAKGLGNNPPEHDLLVECDGQTVLESEPLELPHLGRGESGVDTDIVRAIDGCDDVAKRLDKEVFQTTCRPHDVHAGRTGRRRFQ